MASVNKVLFLGRLTRDPEVKMFASGGKVANFGFAVDGERKKNQQSGQWESTPCFIDCSAFNRGENGRTADLVEQYLRKGSRAHIEGHLVLEQWTSQDGAKRSKHKLVVDAIQFLDRREQQQQGRNESYSSPQDNDPLPPPGPGDENIPF